MRAFSIFVVCFLTFAAFADDSTVIGLPSNVNGIRCNTREHVGDFYMDVFNGNLDTMYWIASDHVQVLSTNLTAVGLVITGLDSATGDKLVFDYPNSDFRRIDAQGNVLMHDADMNCALCPTDQDRCPNSQTH